MRCDDSKQLTNRGNRQGEVELSEAPFVNARGWEEITQQRERPLRGGTYIGPKAT